MRSIYFDYNASTPLDGAVREAMMPFLGEVYGNPSSLHHVGRKARAQLDEARCRVAAVWRCKPSEVLFTSGGTESVNGALFGVARRQGEKRRHLVTSAIEHHAVLHTCDYLARKEGFQVTHVPVTSEGFIDPEAVVRAIRPDTVLVSIMAANNETGAIQPVAEIGRQCRERGILFHTDAVQSFGKVPFESIEQFEADLVSVCAHKLHGPKGAGALFIRSPLPMDPILFGGGHENDRRAGTENLAGIIGFTEAMERFVREPVFEPERLRPLTDRIRSLENRIDGVSALTPSVNRLCNTVAFAVEGTDSFSLLAGLDLEGICASSGSACSSGSLEPSHVLRAIKPEAGANSCLIRFSLGRGSTMREVEAIEAVLPEVIRRARSNG